jgi:hypothetical protein
MGTFTTGVWAITLFYLWRGRRDSWPLTRQVAASGVAS